MEFKHKETAEKAAKLLGISSEKLKNSIFQSDNNFNQKVVIRFYKNILYKLVLTNENKKQFYLQTIKFQTLEVVKESFFLKN